MLLPTWVSRPALPGPGRASHTDGRGTAESKPRSPVGGDTGRPCGHAWPPPPAPGRPPALSLREFQEPESSGQEMSRRPPGSPKAGPGRDICCITKPSGDRGSGCIMSLSLRKAASQNYSATSRTLDAGNAALMPKVQKARAPRLRSASDGSHCRASRFGAQQQSHPLLSYTKDHRSPVGSEGQPCTRQTDSSLSWDLTCRACVSSRPMLSAGKSAETEDPGASLCSLRPGSRVPEDAVLTARLQVSRSDINRRNKKHNNNNKIGK